MCFTFHLPRTQNIMFTCENIQILSSGRDYVLLNNVLLKALICACKFCVCIWRRACVSVW